MKAKTKKGFRVLGIIVLIVVIAIGGFSLFIKYQMSQVPGMSFEDVLNYTAQDNEDIKITVGIIKDGEMEYTVYGNNGTILPKHEYQYEIGSLTKTFTTSLISKAISERKMALEAPIRFYLTLPEKEYYPTIERLVTHTSGYKGHYFDKQFITNFLNQQSNDLYGINSHSLISRVEKTDLEDKTYPWVYSNFGVSVAGKCVANAYRNNFRPIMNEFVQNDLGMKDTRISDGTGDLTGYWQWGVDDAYLPAGALISDISDMLQYCQLHMKEEIPYLAATHERLAEIDDVPATYENMGIYADAMGMGWIIDDQNKIYWHNGGTSESNSYLAFDKERQIGVVILSNAGPNYRIPATVMGVKLIQELQGE